MLKKLYSSMQAEERRLGGGEGVCGVYGSIACAGMDRVVAMLKHHAAFATDSVLVDIGSGLGRPLAHVAMDPGVRRGIGIEIDSVKHVKALEFTKRVFAKMQLDCDVLLLNKHIKDVLWTDGTHAYTFWEGFSADDKARVAEFFNTSNMKHIVVVQRAMRDPCAAMHDHGFARLRLLDKTPVTMSGSGRAFHAYLFETASV